MYTLSFITSLKGIVFLQATAFWGLIFEGATVKFCHLEQVGLNFLLNTIKGFLAIQLTLESIQVRVVDNCIGAYSIHYTRGLSIGDYDCAFEFWNAVGHISFSGASELRDFATSKHNSSSVEIRRKWPHESIAFSFKVIPHILVENWSVDCMMFEITMGKRYVILGFLMVHHGSTSASLVYIFVINNRRQKWCSYYNKASEISTSILYSILEDKDVFNRGVLLQAKFVWIRLKSVCCSESLL